MNLKLQLPPAVKSCHHPVSGVQTSLANLHGTKYKARDVTVTLCIVITIRVGGKKKKKTDHVRDLVFNTHYYKSDSYDWTI